MSSSVSVNMKVPKYQKLLRSRFQCTQPPATPEHEEDRGERRLHERCRGRTDRGTTAT